MSGKMGLSLEASKPCSIAAHLLVVGVVLLLLLKLLLKQISAAFAGGVAATGGLQPMVARSHHPPKNHAFWFWRCWKTSVMFPLSLPLPLSGCHCKQSCFHNCFLAREVSLELARNFPITSAFPSATISLGRKQLLVAVFPPTTLSNHLCHSVFLFAGSGDDREQD